MKSYTSAVKTFLPDFNTHHMNCDICQEKKEDAASFCVDCEKKLCEEHDKVCPLRFKDKTRHFNYYAYIDVLMPVYMYSLQID